MGRPGMFDDDCGNPSSMRVLTFVFVIFCVIATSYVLAIWGYIALKTGEFPKLDFGDLFGIFGGMGALGFKAVQKKFEQPFCKPEFKRSMPEDME